MKKNIRLSSLLKLLFLLQFLKCVPDRTCINIIEKLRNESYNFVLEEKQLENRYKVFKGKNKNFKVEIIRTTGFIDMYEMAEIGDTVRKDLGKSSIFLIKPDTTFEFFAYCNGEKVIP